MNQFDFNISLEEVLRLSLGTIRDAHFYEAITSHPENSRILRRYNSKTFEDFNKVFLKGIIKFRKKKYLTKDVIKMIRDAGGYAVLAHAFWKRDTIQEIREKTEIFQKWGLNGIETFYSRHSQEQTLKLHQMAQELSTIENPVYETMGSDYHSSNRAGEFRKIGYIHTYGLKPNFFLPL